MVQILRVQGRITLLMGPPGSGKSVFLKMLAGRFKPLPELRMSGSVKYNGCTPDEFVVSRTVGLVDQYDSTPLLTSETLSNLPRSETTFQHLRSTSLGPCSSHCRHTSHPADPADNLIPS